MISGNLVSRRDIYSGSWQYNSSSKHFGNQSSRLDEPAGRIFIVEPSKRVKNYVLPGNDIDSDVPRSQLTSILCCTSEWSWTGWAVPGMRVSHLGRRYGKITWRVGEYGAKRTIRLFLRLRDELVKRSVLPRCAIFRALPCGEHFYISIALASHYSSAGESATSMCRFSVTSRTPSFP